MNTYQLDTTVALSVTFTGSDGVTPVDPDAVTLLIRAPDGTVSEVTGGDISNPSTGVFTYDLLLNQSGPWVYKWEGAGTIDVGTIDTYMNVDRSAVIDA